MCIHPLAVGLLHRKLLLYFGIPQEFTRTSIDGDHLTWRKSALLDDFRVIDFVGAGLRAKGDESFFRNLVSCRSKSVSIQTSGDCDSIAEYKSGRAIPRLIETPVILVESLEFRSHSFVGPPCWWYQHRHRVQNVAT